MVEYVKEVITTWDNAPKLNNDGFTLVKSKRGKKGKTSAAPEDLLPPKWVPSPLNSCETFRNFFPPTAALISQATLCAPWPRLSHFP